MFRPKKNKRHLNLFSTERYIGNKNNSVKTLDKLGFDTRKNIIVIGSASSGKCHHPWGRHTEKSDIATTINNWNNDKTKDANTGKSSEMAFDKEEYLKHLSEDIFVVKYKEHSTGRIFEINPQINNSFYDTRYRNAFQTGEYILISGELPEKWK